MFFSKMHLSKYADELLLKTAPPFVAAELFLKLQFINFAEVRLSL